MPVFMIERRYAELVVPTAEGAAERQRRGELVLGESHASQHGLTRRKFIALTSAGAPIAAV